jgi:hypothetical protein
MPHKQRTIDFCEAAKLDAIHRAKLTTRGPAKSVLLEVARQEAAHPSLKQLAKAIGKSVQTVRRALRELEDLGLVGLKACRGDDGSNLPNIIEIDWQKVFGLPADNLEGDGTTDGGGYFHEAVVVPPRTYLHDPPATPAPGGEGGAHLVCAHISKVHSSHEMRDEKNEIKTFEEPDEIEAAGKRWLSRQLSPRDLRDPRALDLLWQFALRRGWVEADTERLRVWFFAVANFCVRCARKGAGNYFTDCVRQRRYNAPANKDDDWARQAIAHLRGGTLRRSADLTCVDELQENEDRERKRRNAITRLKALEIKNG